MNNIDTPFCFEDYLKKNLWAIRNNVWRKGNKSIHFTNNGLMIALNNSKEVKHKHIVTCETPIDFWEAEVIFKKCRLNFNTKKDDSKNEH